MTTLTNRQRLILKALTHDAQDGGENETPWRTAEEVIGIVQRLSPEDVYPLGKAEAPNTVGHTMADWLDQMQGLGLVEKRKTPTVQYRRVWKSIPWAVDQVRRIQQRCSADTVLSGKAEEGVVLVDQLTASLLMAVHDKVSRKNRQKLIAMDVIDAVSLCWRLQQRGAISVGFKAA